MTDMMIRCDIISHYNYYIVLDGLACSRSCIIILYYTVEPRYNEDLGTMKITLL